MDVDAVALDAMGVMYVNADDVLDLLMPYLRGKGSTLDRDGAKQLYRSCSRGTISSAQFWQAAGAADASDAEYCLGHRLAPGLMELLAGLRDAGYRLACLSNDVTEWSVVLRERFGLTAYIEDWVISGDLGVRKPDPRAYEALCDRLGLEPHRILFVDDRLENVTAARDAGLRALRFGVAPASTMSELADAVLEVASRSGYS